MPPFHTQAPGSVPVRVTTTITSTYYYDGLKIGRGSPVGMNFLELARFYRYPFLSFKDAMFPSFVRFFLTHPLHHHWPYGYDGVHFHSLGSRVLIYGILAPFFVDQLKDIPSDDRVEAEDRGFLGLGASLASTLGIASSGVGQAHSDKIDPSHYHLSVLRMFPAKLYDNRVIVGTSRAVSFVSISMFSTRNSPPPPSLLPLLLHHLLLLLLLLLLILLLSTIALWYRLLCRMQTSGEPGAEMWANESTSTASSSTRSDSPRSGPPTTTLLIRRSQPPWR